MSLPKIYRAWVNAPSALHGLHNIDGKRCICVEYEGDTHVELHFTEGVVHSMVVPIRYITKAKLSSAEN